MKLCVFKNNAQLDEINLSDEIIGLDGAEISFYIGRSEDCHIHLDDQKISREHAKISFSNGNWMINQISGYGDLIINGVLIKEKELLSGDIVTIGPYVINASHETVLLTPETKSEGPRNLSPTDNTETILGGHEALEEVFSDNGVVDGGDDDLDFTGNEFMNEANQSDGESEVENEEALINDPILGEDLIEADDEFNFDSTGDEDPFSDNDNGIDEGAADEPTGIFNLDKKLDSDDSDLSDKEEALSTEENGDGQEEYTPEEYEESDAENGEFESNELNEEYGVDSYGEDKTQVITSFVKIELEIFGELAPFDKYLLEGAEVMIGRDPEKCGIILNDPEVSGCHALIKRNNIICSLQDLGSGNGTLLNGVRVNKSSLTDNDEFVIGSTTFTVHIISELIDQEKNRLMPVEENQIVEVEEIVEISEEEADSTAVKRQITTKNDGNFSLEAEPSSSSSLFSKDSLKDPEKRKKILIFAILLMGVWVLLSEDEPSKTKKVKSKTKKSRILGEDKKSKSKKKSRLIVKLNAEQLEFLDGTYILSKEFIDQGRYREALTELDKIHLKLKGVGAGDSYKQSITLKEIATQGLAKLEELDKKKQAEIDRKKRISKVTTLVEMAKKSVKERKMDAAYSYFAKIMELDPDNFDVPQLKIELSSWKKNQDRMAIEKAQKKSDRKRMVDALAPSKSFYLKKEWYKAVLKLETFLRLKQMDEDLIKEASKMLDISKKTLNGVIDPLIGKARSLSEGQDLKGAYEMYGEVLQTDPTHDEAINEMSAIRQKLTTRSRKVYREAIISESLSLFDDAKEKFQEVQQISPTDSEYYKKATSKLKYYLD